MSSDIEFSDDDEIFALTALPRTQDRNSTSNTSINTHQDGLHALLQKDLNTARGEISILRAQLKQLETTKLQEIHNLKESNQSIKQANDEQIKLLKNTIERVEDENKFLNNEIKNAPRKKRKKNNAEEAISNANFTTIQTIIKRQIIPNDSIIFTDQILNHSICGAPKTVMNYLSNIGISFEFEQNDLRIGLNDSISSSILNYLVVKKNILRIDDLVEDFCYILVSIIKRIIELDKDILSVPFLVSLIQFSINFRPAATKKNTIIELIKFISDLCSIYLPNFKKESYESNERLLKLKQHIILENFLIINSFDLLEDLTHLSIFHSNNINGLLPVKFINLCLNIQTPINLVFNIVEILICCLNDNDSEVFEKSSDVMRNLIVLLSNDIPIQDNFMLYGLKRILGNNFDFDKIDSIVDLSNNNALDLKLISVPLPLSESIDQNYRTIKYNQVKFEIELNHEIHLLNLKIRILKFIENYSILNDIQFLQNKDYIKNLIWCIAKEQEVIIKSPRSEIIHLRCQIISYLVKIIYLIIKKEVEIMKILNSETLQELIIVFTRISFSANKLSNEAAKYISESRESQHKIQYLFNHELEQKALQLNHLTNDSDINKIIEAQKEYTNGVEFPYDSIVIELSREILEMCTTIEEGDNCYLNMNVPIEVIDEMDYLDD